MTELVRTYKLTDSGAWGWVTEEAEGGDGGSLPSWWTVDSTPGAELVTFGGAGIFAPTRTDVALLTLQAPVGYEGGYYQPFEIKDSDGNVITTFSIGGDLDVLAPAGSGGGAGWQIRSVDFPNNRIHLDARQISLAKEGNNQPLMSLSLVDAGGVPTGDRLGADAQARLELANVSGPPDDADIAAGRFYVFTDATDGAAKLKIKGKSANGTVVNGELALT